MFFVYWQSKDKTGLSLCIVYSSTPWGFSTSCWGSSDKWQSCRFNSNRVSNTCHNSFSLQLSKCWLLHGEMRCAIKANLSLYSCVNPAMFNQPRSRRAPGRRDESREVWIHTQSEGRRSTRAVNSIWKSTGPTTAHRLISDTWKCSSEIIVNPASALSGGPMWNPIWQKRRQRDWAWNLHVLGKVTAGIFIPL